MKSTDTADVGAGSLREAISDANNAAGADTINFTAGLNDSTITLTSGQIDIDEALIIDASALASGITIDGNGLGNTGIRRIFGMTVAEKLTLNNLVITNGLTTADNILFSLSIFRPDCAGAPTISFASGGAICTEGSLELIDTTISNSRTTGHQSFGGGAYANGPITLINSTVSGNSTADANGGGLFTYSGITLTNSTVSGNRTAGFFASGGGFYTSNTTLTNSTVSGNSTAGNDANGGGFVAFGFTTLSNSTVSGNRTAGDNARGGGFYAWDTTLSDSTVSGNSTAGNGAYGGGINMGARDLILNNSTISQNIASHANGDGVFMSGTYVDSNTITLNSSILAGNGADNIAFSLRSAPASVTINANNSLFGDAGAEITGTNIDNVFNNTPGLAMLADNGCTTLVGAPATAVCVQTHGLLAGSPAIDAGATNGLTTDQRGTGFARVVNGQADIGAFELVAAPALAPESIPTLNVWLLSLLSLMLSFVARTKKLFSKER